MEHVRAEYEKAIDGWVRSERDRKALKRKYLDGITHEAIAEELCISPKTVQNIVNKWRDIIARHL